MSGNQSIGAIGMYPNFSNVDYQYLAAAMNSPYYNQVGFNGNAQATNMGTHASYVAPQAPQCTVPEKKNHTARNILIGVGIVAVGAAALFYAKGNNNLKLLDRIKDGAKTVFKSNAAASAAEKATTATEQAVAGKNTVQTINGKTVVTLADQKNIIYAKNATTELADIGEKVEVGKFADRLTKTGTLKEGNKLESLVMESKITQSVGRGNYTIIGAQGGEKITILKDGVKVERGIGLGNKGINENVYDTLVERIKNVFSGKTPLNDKDLTIQQAIVKNTNKETGLVSKIKVNGLVKDKATKKMVAGVAKEGKESLIFATTNRFNINNKNVNGLRLNNKPLDEVLKAVENKKFDGLSILRGKIYDPNTKCMFTVDGSGKVLSYSYKNKGQTIIVDAVKNKVDFDNFHYLHQNLFNDIAKSNKKTWTDIVFGI